VNPVWFVRPDGYNASGSIHGLGHTVRVMTHALELADVLDMRRWEREALGCAAMWHDIGRTDDAEDYFHGAKSAGKAVALGLHHAVEPQVYETALYAITHHCGSEEYGERAAQGLGYYSRDGNAERRREHIDPEAALRVFRVLKDADALDRVRLGDLNPDYLRFAESHGRVERARQLLREQP